MIRIQTPSIQLHLDDTQTSNESAKRKYVFIKDAETGQSARVIKGSSEMTDIIKMIAIEQAHAYWSIPACDACDGDGAVEYQDLDNQQRSRPCVACYGYGIKPQELI